MLWLGFWFKSIYHLIDMTPFVEPTGLFSGTTSQWDHALLVSSMGALAVLCGGTLASLFNSGSNKNSNKMNE